MPCAERRAEGCAEEQQQAWGARLLRPLASCPLVPPPSAMLQLGQHQEQLLHRRQQLSKRHLNPRRAATCQVAPTLNQMMKGHRTMKGRRIKSLQKSSGHARSEVCGQVQMEAGGGRRTGGSGGTGGCQGGQVGWWTGGAATVGCFMDSYTRVTVLLGAYLSKCRGWPARGRRQQLSASICKNPI